MTEEALESRAQTDQCTNAAAALLQTSMLKPQYLGYLLFSVENIPTKAAHVVLYEIVTFPDNEHLVDVP